MKFIQFYSLLVFWSYGLSNRRRLRCWPCFKTAFIVRVALHDSISRYMAGLTICLSVCLSNRLFVHSSVHPAHLHAIRIVLYPTLFSQAMQSSFFLIVAKCASIEKFGNCVETNDQNVLLNSDLNFNNFTLFLDQLFYISWKFYFWNISNLKYQ